MTEFRIDQATPGAGTSNVSRHDLVVGEIINLVATSPTGPGITYSWEILDKVGSAAVLSAPTGISTTIGPFAQILSPCAFLIRLTVNDNGVVTTVDRIASVRTTALGVRVPLFPETAPVSNTLGSNNPDLSTDNAVYTNRAGTGVAEKNWRGWAEWAYEIALAVEAGGGGGPPTGAAGGDLGSTYPNPAVVKLQGYSVDTLAPVQGNALVWDGAKWSPQRPPGDTLVYRPGGVASGNVYTTWASLMSTYVSSEGPITIEIDDSIVSPAVMPAGAYTIRPDTTFRGLRRPGLLTYLQLADGVTLSALPHVTDRLRITSLSSAPVLTTSAGSLLILLSRGGGLSTAGTSPFIEHAHATNQVVIDMVEGGQIATGTQSVLSIKDPGGGISLAYVLVGESCAVGPDTIEGDGGNAAVLVEIRNISATVSFSQVAWASAVQPVFGDSGGAISVSNPSWRLYTTTAYHVAAPGEVVLCDPSGGGFSIDLPDAGTGSRWPGVSVTVKNQSSSSNAIVIGTIGPATIDGAPTFVLSSPWSSVTFVWDGQSEWSTITISSGSAPFGLGGVPVAVTKAAASAGVGTSAARSDHKHDISTAVVGDVKVGDAPLEGTATTLARSDHTHGMTAPGAPVNVKVQAASAGAASEAARADHAHNVDTAAPGATGVATASAVGVSANLARADHAHQSNTAPVNTSKSAAAIGTSGEPARADHKHDVDTAAPSGWSLGIGGFEGAASTLARSDHVHATTAPLAPANVTKAAASAGLSSAAARSDHKHDITTAAAVANPPGTSNAEGASTSLARADHTHALAAFGTTAGTFVEGNDSRITSVDLLIPPGNQIAIRGDFASNAAGTNSSVYFSFLVPADFGTLVSAAVIGIPLATFTTQNIDLFSDFGAVGEVFNVNSVSETTLTYSGTINVLLSINVAVLLAGIAANDHVGVQVDHVGIGTTVDYIGLRLRYTKA